MQFYKEPKRKNDSNMKARDGTNIKCRLRGGRRASLSCDVARPSAGGVIWCVSVVSSVANRGWDVTQAQWRWGFEVQNLHLLCTHGSYLRHNPSKSPQSVLGLKSKESWRTRGIIWRLFDRLPLVSFCLMERSSREDQKKRSTGSHQQSYWKDSKLGRAIKSLTSKTE